MVLKSCNFPPPTIPFPVYQFPKQSTGPDEPYLSKPRRSQNKMAESEISTADRNVIQLNKAMYRDSEWVRAWRSMFDSTQEPKCNDLFWVYPASYLGNILPQLTQTERKVNHSRLSSNKDKNGWTIISSINVHDIALRCRASIASNYTLMVR
jgi:hypothetical protein